VHVGWEALNRSGRGDDKKERCLSPGNRTLVVQSVTCYGADTNYQKSTVQVPHRLGL
jgi:hypothetical protein